MTVDIEQLKAALRDAILENARLQEQLATMRQQLAALQALSRDLQPDTPPAAPPWQGQDGWEGRT